VKALVPASPSWSACSGSKLQHRSAATGASPAIDAQPIASNDTHEPESERVIAAQRETIEQMDATIRDLRARLDRETEERRQLIAILTDQRRRPWWRRWFR
jgi:hypothetical protein